MHAYRFRRATRLLFVLLAAAILAGCATSGTPVANSGPSHPVGNPDGSLTLVVSPQVRWTDSGLYLMAGDKVKVSAQGTWGETPGVERGPDGGDAGVFGSGYWGVQRIVPTAPWGALLAKVGGAPAFVVGTQNTFVATQEGELLFACNDGAGQQAKAHGELTLRIEITPHAQVLAPSPAILR